MSDLEVRLTEALNEAANAAPGATGLATAARSRARDRRRTRVAGVAGAVVLAVGVPTAVLVARGAHDDQTPHRSGTSVAKDPSGPGRTLPAGYHYESWHDVTIEVPDTWGYGSLSDWCADQGTLDTPRVERPGTVHLDILCSPGSSYGVTFAPAQQDGTVDWPVAEQHSEAWPGGAFVGATTVGDVVVTVAAPDLLTAQGVISSAQRNERLDPNGCPIDSGSDPVVPAGTMAVCRYDATGLLEQSELLRGHDVDAAQAAVKGASRASDEGCSPDTPGESRIRLASLTEDAEVSLGCGSFSDQGVLRTLTSDVLYWALSPGWSGGVDADVPLPPELRQR
jgi:hypothetical protein